MRQNQNLSIFTFFLFKSLAIFIDYFHFWASFTYWSEMHFQFLPSIDLIIKRGEIKILRRDIVSVVILSSLSWRFDCWLVHIVPNQIFCFLRFWFWFCHSLMKFMLPAVTWSENFCTSTDFWSSNNCFSDYSVESADDGVAEIWIEWKSLKKSFLVANFICWCVLLLSFFLPLILAVPTDPKKKKKNQNRQFGRWNLSTGFSLPVFPIFKRLLYNLYFSNFNFFWFFS